MGDEKNVPEKPKSAIENILAEIQKNGTVSQPKTNSPAQQQGDASQSPTTPLENLKNILSAEDNAAANKQGIQKKDPKPATPTQQLMEAATAKNQIVVSPEKLPPAKHVTPADEARRREFHAIKRLDELIQAHRLK